MKRYILFWVGMVIIVNGFAQNHLFILSPVVGDTIDRTEKLDYMLFPDVNDSTFKYCYITKSTNRYFVNTVTQSDSVFVQEVDSLRIKSYQENIEKLSEYYSNLEKQDSIKNAEKLTLMPQITNSHQVNNQLINQQDRKLIIDKVRQANRLQEDAERHQQVLDGNDIFGDGMRVEFRTKKRK